MNILLGKREERVERKIWSPVLDKTEPGVEWKESVPRVKGLGPL